MESFQVLGRHLNIRKNYLLEASAGTGKTFSIEHIVVRLLIEEDPCCIEEILVMTFTRAATRDLKVRIHNNIMSAIYFLNEQEIYSGTCPDYIKKIIESGSEAIKKALRNLERAICGFDFAQIFTIHSFCAQMLSENIIDSDLKIANPEEINAFNGERLRRTIRDFFRGKALTENFSKAQLKTLLKYFQGDLKELETSLQKAILKGMEIAENPTFPKLLTHFNETMKRLKQNFKLDSKTIRDHLVFLAPRYKIISDRKGNVTAEFFEEIIRFSSLFDKGEWVAADLDWLIEDQLFVLKHFEKKNLKAGESAEIPDILKMLKKSLQEYVSPSLIFSRVAFDCLAMVNRIKEKEECFGYDDLLKKMYEAVANPEFNEKVRIKYKAAIIDEFQDTDPRQWEIIKRLFLCENNCHSILYLVGDPKQSIYSFRQADIYTYMDAASRIGIENHYSLDTNFRSHLPLVKALNVLFRDASSRGLFSLPKRNCYLQFPEVKTPENSKTKNFSDLKGSVHFFITEESGSRNTTKTSENAYFFPFIVNEIQYLNEKENFSFNQMAILVSDRHQANRVCEFLFQWNIPVLQQRTTSLVDTPAFAAIRELLEAILDPKDESNLKIALGGKIIRWTHEEIKSLEDPLVMEAAMYHVFFLNEDLMQRGFASFYQNLLKLHWKKDRFSTLERLLVEEDGEEFLQDLQQIADLLLEKENCIGKSPEGLLDYLKQITLLASDDEEIPKRISDPSKNGVRIMTTHASKGLEFDIVFTLGLISRNPLYLELFPAENRLFAVVDKENEHYKLFCNELDAEKIRLLYVAMTRAKYRLYSPILSRQIESPIEMGSASPMELFLQGISTCKFVEYIRSLQSEVQITYSLLNDDSFSLKKVPIASESCIIKEPPQIVIPGKARYIQSFTSLHFGASQRELLSLVPKDFCALEKTPHTLPAGINTGTVLHKCLESIPFEVCQTVDSSNGLERLLLPHLLGTEFENWLTVICEMVFRAMKASLNGKFALSDVSSRCCYKETEFLYPSEMRKYPGYIKGFIDLFFMHEDRYYFLDWKSNWLGSDFTSYSKDCLHKAMEENGYYLQARLYYEAVQKYLKLVDGRPFEEIFGGIYYVFLRGLSPELEQHGILEFKKFG